MSEELARALKAAIARWDAMSAEEREAMLAAQRESWVRGEMALGSDADEAEWRRQNMPRDMLDG